MKEKKPGDFLGSREKKPNAASSFRIYTHLKK